MTKKKVLILFAHPRLEKSRANKALLRHVPHLPNITFHDLYERYPDFNIDLDFEKTLLLEHDLIVWQHPFYWYSAPPLLKQWIDVVLEFGWAYGPGGNALAGKLIFNLITTGGGREVYSREGRNRYTVGEFLVPFNQTATLCQMTYLPPFVVQGTHRLTDTQLEEYALQYEHLLEILASKDFQPGEMCRCEFLNDWLANEQSSSKA